MMARQTTTADAAVSAAVERVTAVVSALRVAEKSNDLAGVLKCSADLERAADQLVGTAVASARERSHTWEAIGDALGVRKQTAWERWHDST